MTANMDRLLPTSQIGEQEKAHTWRCLGAHSDLVLLQNYYNNNQQLALKFNLLK